MVILYCNYLCILDDDGKIKYIDHLHDISTIQIDNYMDFLKKVILYQIYTYKLPTSELLQ